MVLSRFRRLALATVKLAASEILAILFKRTAPDTAALAAMAGLLIQPLTYLRINGCPPYRGPELAADHCFRQYSNFIDDLQYPN